jgi:hypothetical protein
VALLKTFQYYDTERFIFEKVGCIDLCVLHVGIAVVNSRVDSE